MRYGVQHYNNRGEVYRTRCFGTARQALERAPWIMPYGNRKPNPDRWRVVRLGGTLDKPVVVEVLAESPRGEVSNVP